MPNTLIKHELDGYSRIRTGQYGGEWFLLFDCALLKDGKVVLVSSLSPRGKPLVAVDQFSQRCIRAERALRPEPRWSDQF
jgi:hypothetical protein